MTEVPPPKEKKKNLILFEKQNPKIPSHDMIQVAKGKHGMIKVKPKWYEVLKIHEVLGGGGGGRIHSPNFLHCLREQNLVVYKYVTN